MQNIEAHYYKLIKEMCEHASKQSKGEKTKYGNMQVIVTYSIYR